ncbi:MAG TPA: alpha/beta hydrolase [Noviherbaspirillum sp.]|uniref:alpha/beta hydrolase n=1 Tax=Noviherbaspirillum sp. TaxID=1926288 RepID=UPI002D6E73EE|nr:alpha/beta hydrolase [Noviherbaspirillum sp.]HYD95274.1 alpha/beta hydrolase [Noviherbaspirillum sp.]
MQKTLSLFLFAGVVAYLAACLALFLFQRALIYFPPYKAAYPAPRISTLAVSGAEIKVSERPLQGTKAALYLGGNAEDVSASLPILEAAFPDHALYLLHYRGYAGSSGKPTEQALVSDALVLLDRIAAEHSEIVVVGRSLGTGVAVHVASVRDVRKLVLVTPFDSLQELAVRQFPFFPVRWLLRDKYESWRYAPRVKAPTLILAAQHDEVIPAWSTSLLLSRFSEGVASMKVISGTGHNSISESASYIPMLQWAR